MAGKFNIESRSLDLREAQIVEYEIHSFQTVAVAKINKSCTDDSIIFVKMLIFASYLDHLWFHFAMDF